jgi:oxygen-dependent protoporphyrinogen oxidase
MALRVAIVGGGISGLASGYFLKAQAPEVALTILEQAPVVGGKVQTTQQDGFVFDWGPNGFLTNAPETLALAKALGLGAALLPASDAAKRRYLFKEGALRRLPSTPLELLTSELLSPAGKLRAAAELLLGRRHSAEESVEAFVRRHFGAEVARTFADVAVSGITAGDAAALSVDALFPRLRGLESQYGSLLKGLIAARRSSASGRLTSFKAGGMARLIAALAAQLAPAIRTGVAVTGLTPAASGYQLRLSTGDTLAADYVILATPAFVSSALLEPMLPEAARLLAEIPYADVGVWGLGYHRMQVPQLLDGFGFLVPRGEGVSALGVLWSSAIFADQAPQNHVMLRVIAGGVRAPDFMQLPPEAQLASIRRDLRLTMGITAEPCFMQVAHWPRGIPQYTLGHPARLARLMALLPPQLLLTGNAYYGVGVNDCVRDAERVARSLLSTASLSSNTWRHSPS